MREEAPFSMLARAVLRHAGRIEELRHACRLLPLPCLPQLAGLARATRHMMDWAAMETELQGGGSASAPQSKAAPAPAAAASPAAAKRGPAHGKRTAGESLPVLFRKDVTVKSGKMAEADPAEYGARKGRGYATPEAPEVGGKIGGKIGAGTAARQPVITMSSNLSLLPHRAGSAIR